MADLTTTEKLAEALRDLIELYDSDDGCRSLSQYIAGREALVEYEREKAGQIECYWTLEDDVNMPGTWNGACGVMWAFPEEGPLENDCKFCPRCGGRLTIIIQDATP